MRQEYKNETLKIQLLAELYESQLKDRIYIKSLRDIECLQGIARSKAIKELIHYDCFHLLEYNSDIYVCLSEDIAEYIMFSNKFSTIQNDYNTPAAIGFKTAEEAQGVLATYIFFDEGKDAMGLFAYQKGLPSLYINAKTHKLFLEEDTVDMEESQINQYIKRECIDIKDASPEYMPAFFVDAMANFNEYFIAHNMRPVEVREINDFRKMVESEQANINEKRESRSTIEPKKKKKIEKVLKSPKEIKKYLDAYIYKQEEAKKAAATLLYCHINNSRRTALFVGPSGCGKTEIFRVLKNIYPQIYIYDASNITNEGWSGSKKSHSVFSNMLYDGMNVEEIEHSIIVFDEFDKLCTPRYSSNGDNVSAAIQAEFLSMIEGTNIYIQNMNVSIDTSNITFIFLGAFENLYSKKKKDRETKLIGFGASTENSSDAEPIVFSVEDMISFGIRTEIMGRIGKIVQLEKLEEKDFYNILKDRKISPVSNLRKKLPCNIRFTEKQLLNIAKVAAETGLGARYLKTQVEQDFDNYIFEHGLKPQIKEIEH